MITEHLIAVTNGVIGGWYATRQRPCFTNNFTVYGDGRIGFDRSPRAEDRRELVRDLNRRPRRGDFLALGRKGNFTYIWSAVRLVRLGVWEVRDENGCAFLAARNQAEDLAERAGYQTLSDTYTL